MPLNKIKFEKFINKLAEYSDINKVDNQYKCDIQIKNLIHYLENMYLLEPSILLVGEAPGYQGCAITGIPFTSEFIISTHCDTAEFNGCIALGKKKERTATVVWRTLDELTKSEKILIKPLMWNIFPFHPIEYGNNKSNRTPTSIECEYGMTILHDLLDLFPSIEEIYAVGQQADKKIKSHPKYVKVLRHPSYGGAKEFKKKMYEIYKW